MRWPCPNYNQRRRMLNPAGFVLMALLIGRLFAPAPALSQEGPKRPNVSRAVLDPILETAIAYAFRFKGPFRRLYNSLSEAKKQKPWLCCISPEVGGSNSTLARSLKRIGADLVDEKWLSQSKRPRKFVYAEIREVEWLTQKRVKVTVYLAGGTNSPDPEQIIWEGGATLLMHTLRHRWVVEEKNSSLALGE